MIARLLLATALVAALLVPPAAAASRVGELTVRPGEVPRRLVGYGLVVGLDGTGDRSLGGSSDASPTVRSVVNLLRRFHIEVPDARLRMRNVAAVLVTSEVSPYLRSGGRFDVQVSALGDATSLRGGVLWMTPLIDDPNAPPAATAQGPLYVASSGDGRAAAAGSANTARIPAGGALEVDPPAAAPVEPRLFLRAPDWTTAQTIVRVVDAAFGAGTAKVEDAGALRLTPPASRAGDLGSFLASVDSLPVTVAVASKIVLDARSGLVVAGGAVGLSPAAVSHAGFTLEIGEAGPAAGATDAAGDGRRVQVRAEAKVQDVVAALHAAGARPAEIAAVFEALRAAGALTAPLEVR